MNANNVPILGQGEEPAPMPDGARAELLKQFERLRNVNAGRMHLLAQMGVGVNVMQEWVEHALQAMLTPDEFLQLQFSWELKLVDILDEVDRKVRLAQLTQGVRS